MGTGEAKLVMQQAMIADMPPSLTHHVPRWGGKQGFGTPSRDLSEKQNAAQRGKDQAQNVP